MFDKHNTVDDDQNKSGLSDALSANERGKVHLNRRSFFQFGLTAVTAAVGVGSLGVSISGKETNTHMTDFSEYV
ncbi:hypothetical protein [Haloarcula japonica]|uniref:Uncharacterized protein n=1 Tax=Haloarcula japonica (strain ATCC 49778 / DSM 6131 / JCM 7785 / NBRC 101032 / NCIMB 13157 / TR-1) TaxID=1227453 RepID=M0L2D2_HALJT|nr:hypothetical protein [Haloarcula japonica]EMA27742.1 hypothetical protein C444_19697 [Haloarcula japonica DSM 6131]